MCGVLIILQKLLVVLLFVLESEIKWSPKRLGEFVHTTDSTFSFNASHSKKLILNKAASSIKIPLVTRKFFLMSESGSF